MNDGRKRAGPTGSDGKTLARIAPLVLGIVLLLAWTVLAEAAWAQREPGRIGVGAHVGRPSGIMAKWYRSAERAYAATLTTDLDDRALVHVFGVQERLLAEESPLHRFLGPGLEIGMIPDGGSRTLAFGLGGVVGLNFYAERFEVVLRAVPHLRVRPRIDPRLGASVGLRYYP
jgi:hypothetical protein